jgi:Co/Zn/Cd efflux system component
MLEANLINGFLRCVVANLRSPALWISACFAVLSLSCSALAVVSSSLVLRWNSFSLAFDALRTFSTLIAKSRHREATLAGGVAVLIDGDVDASIFPFGVARLPILLNFAAGVIYVFSALTLIVEAACEPTHSHGDVQPALVELIIAMQVALILASRDILRNHRNERLCSLVRTVKECSSPIVVLVSYVAAASYEWDWADTASTVLLSVGVLVKAAGTLTSDARVLLNCAPSGALREECDKCLQKAELVPGVLGVSDFRFWMLDRGRLVVFLKVIAAAEANERAVVLVIRRIFEPVSAQITVHCQRCDSPTSTAVCRRNLSSNVCSN